MKKFILILLLIFISVCGRLTYAENGYKLWLKYNLVSNKHLLKEYRGIIKGTMVKGESPTIRAASEELQKGLNGMLGEKIPGVKNIDRSGIILAGSFNSSPLFEKLNLKNDLKKIGPEGFIIRSSKINGENIIAVTANSDIGVLYGVFRFLSLLQTERNISDLNIISFPRIKLRMLNHWDNLDGTRVYPGFSIWDWHTLPEYIKRNKRF